MAARSKVAPVVDVPLSPPELEVARSTRRPVFGHLLVVTSIALTAVNVVVAKVVIESSGLSVMRLSQVRSLGAGLLLFVALALVRPLSLRLSRQELIHAAVFGVCGIALGQLLFYIAIKNLDIGVAVVILYLAPFFVVAWSRFLVRERLPSSVWIALGLSLAGVSLVVELWRGLTLNGVGVAAALGGAGAYAIYILSADYGLKRGREVTVFLTWGFLLASLFWFIVQPWWNFPGHLVSEEASLQGRLDDVTVPLWSLLTYTVVLGTLVPFILFVAALKHLPPTRVVIIAMLEPMFAALAAFLWLGEKLSAQQIAGGVLVLTSVVFAQIAGTRLNNNETLKA